MNRRYYNPKSHAPAVYIPAWLLQIPSEKLSLQAKILYGRLSQWANSKSCVHRSTKQLAEEIGVDQRVVKRFLAELREVGLIETYQKIKGGENYYKFLDHEWIHADLLPVFDWNKNDQDSNENDIPPTEKKEIKPTTKTSVPYHENVTIPVTKMSLPRDENVTTPVTKTSLPRDENVTPKVKEIKESKINIKAFRKKPEKAENAKKHAFAESMDQMAFERRHIEEHETRKREEMRGSDVAREALRSIKDMLRFTNRVPKLV